MNKDVFLYELERLLFDIPKEEREEAMDYYRSYFEDAGAENEAAVIEELESPQQIAASIKEGLSISGDMTSFLKNPPQVRESQSRTQQGTQNTSGAASDGTFGNSAKQDDQASSGRAFYRRYDEYEKKGQKGAPGGMDKRTKLILIVIAAVFLIPVWGTVASALFGIAGAMIAAVVVLGIFSVGGVIGGIACTITAVIKLCTLSLIRGLFFLAVGMLLIAGSGISIVLLMLLCGRLLPWAVNQGIQLFRKLVLWGRSLA